MIKSLKNRNPLTTIPAHQPQHHHHLSPSIVTFTISSTLNMWNETFKTGHGNVPQWTEENRRVWKQMVCRVLIANTAYNIITAAELLPPGNGVALRALQENWHDRANMGIALVIHGCWDELLPLIDNIDDPVEMWEALWDWLDNSATKHVCIPVRW